MNKDDLILLSLKRDEAATIMAALHFWSYRVKADPLKSGRSRCWYLASDGGNCTPLGHEGLEELGGMIDTAACLDTGAPIRPECMPFQETARERFQKCPKVDDGDYDPISDESCQRVDVAPVIASLMDHVREHLRQENITAGQLGHILAGFGVAFVEELNGDQIHPFKQALDTAIKHNPCSVEALDTAIKHTPCSLEALERAADTLWRQHLYDRDDVQIRAAEVIQEFVGLVAEEDSR